MRIRQEALDKAMVVAMAANEAETSEIDAVMLLALASVTEITRRHGIAQDEADGTKGIVEYVEDLYKSFMLTIIDSLELNGFPARNLLADKIKEVMEAKENGTFHHNVTLGSVSTRNGKLSVEEIKKH